MVDQKIRLGDLLVKQGVISAEQLAEALALQQKNPGKLGRLLIDMDVITEEKLLSFLSTQLSLPYVDLKHYQFNPEIVSKISETYARRYRAIALAVDDHKLVVGMSDPLDLFAQDELARLIRQPIKIALVRESDLLRSLDLVYRRTQEINNFAEQLDDQIDQNQADFTIDLAQLRAEEGDLDAPVVKLLRSLFEDAIQIGASDIHIEPDLNLLRLRLRIDGLLHEQIIDETRIAVPLTLRLKLMANLNISEKRLPQDGRFNIKVKNKNIDVRISTMPIQYGESVVMRLLDQSSTLLDLKQLHMPAALSEQFQHLLNYPHGMILVTGPTGSGKTTTLYAALNALNQPGVKIITVEDPVEYRLARVNQVQVDSKIDLSFAKVLRTVLRQDPNIILVGEIRDQETAEIAARAALTGHLVFATLHTNDAVSAAIRLLEMGVPGFIIASVLRGVLAQRLVRKICEHCAIDHTLSVQERAWLTQFAPQHENTTFKHGRGCTYCHQSGYQGRQAIYELLTLNDAMASALRRNHPDHLIKTAAASVIPLRQQALHLATQGITTLNEVFRVVGTLNEEISAQYIEDAR